MKLGKRVIIGVILLGVFGFLGYRIYSAYAKQQAASGGPQASRGAGGGPGGAAARVVSVSLGKSRAGQVREEILLTGALKAKEQVDVTAKATGRVEALHVQVGDAVNKGALIAEMEDDELQQQVNRSVAAQTVARASSEQREAELANAKAELERTQALLTEGLVPQQEYQARATSYRVVQAQYELARAQQQQAQAELKELQIRLEQTKIYAPMSGHIGRRYIDPGALVSPSTPIVHLVRLATMVMMANVPERDIAKMRVGTHAAVVVDAFGERKFTARVARISPVLDAATRSASVEIEIPNPDLSLKAEMFARVILDLESIRQAVLIPREALVYRGQQPGVFLLDHAERPVFHGVETGLSRGEDVEVLARLDAGVTIVTRGASMLNDGDQIRVAGARGERGQGQGQGQERVPRSSTTDDSSPRAPAKLAVVGPESPAPSQPPAAGR